MEFTNDCILGYPLTPDEFSLVDSGTITYFVKSLGNIRVTMPAYTELLNVLKLGTENDSYSDAFPRFQLAGIARNAYERQQEPPLFDSLFIREGYKQEKVPATFKEKSNHLLMHLYSQGGNENQKFELNSTRDFPLTYTDTNEFERIVEGLVKAGHIRYSKRHQTGRVGLLFMSVELTAMGIDEAEKQLPVMPLVGLVEQQIETGDVSTNERINHAKSLFFGPYATAHDKRSACETLSYVLEPFRDDLASFFTTSDVSDFFQLVNRFDIRHNKSTTTNLIYEEQLEWVFYTLLNTINTYVKLKNSPTPL